MKDIMIDLETLGTSFNALITQIGACYFDRHTGEIGDTLDINIEIGSSLDKGFSVDSGALKFWFNHSPTFLNNAVSIEKALALFGDFITKKSLIWCHATFDAIILANAYERINQGIPYSYRNVRDIRTLTDLAKLERKDRAEGNKDPKTHNALEDAIYQVGYCTECFNKL